MARPVAGVAGLRGMRLLPPASRCRRRPAAAWPCSPHVHLGGRRALRGTCPSRPAAPAKANAHQACTRGDNRHCAEPPRRPERPVGRPDVPRSAPCTWHVRAPSRRRRGHARQTATGGPRSATSTGARYGTRHPRRSPWPRAGAIPRDLAIRTAVAGPGVWRRAASFP